MNPFALLLSFLPLWIHPMFIEPTYQQPVNQVVEFNIKALQLQRQWDLFNMRNPFSAEYNPSFNLYYKIEQPDSIQVFVSRFTKLDRNFVPKNLVLLSDLDPSLPARFMRKEAAISFVRLKRAVFEATNIRISTNSAYRSYDTQAALFNRYVALDGFEKANTYSALPGHSEHQTGLAIDLIIVPSILEFGDSQAYPWFKQNAHRFGFIERYPNHKSHITSYIHEPWHWRYVGIELATFLFNTQMTFDEYWIMGLIE